MRWFTLSVLAAFGAAIASAQSFGSMFDKAPADVDAALRARIDHFYQSHVNEKYRQADQDVHEDSKDIFFAADKPHYKSCKIASIRYEENYTKAKVVMDCAVDYFFPGVGMVKDAPVPIPSSWKFDQGQWWWYVVPVNREQGQATPFGQMKAGPEGAGSTNLTSLFDAAPKPQDLQGMVSADKASIQLQSHIPSSDEVTISSRFPGSVELQMDPVDKPGLTVKLEKTTLKTGESTKLTIAYKPAVPVKQADLVLQIHVDKTNHIIPVLIKFAYPPFTEQGTAQTTGK